MSRTKKQKRTAEQRITRARAALVLVQPFYGTLLMNLNLKPTTQYPTMATNGVDCVYNPAFVDEQSDEEVLFTLCHEADHVALLDHTRRRHRDPELWNIATDYRINAGLVKAKIGKMPKGGLLDARFDGLAAEDIYAILEAEKQQQSQSQSQDDSDDDSDESDASSGGSDEQSGDSDESGDDQSQASGAQRSEQGAGSSSGAGDDSDEQNAASDAPGASEGQGEGEQGDAEASGSSMQQTTGDPGSCGEILDAPGDEGEIAEQERHWQTVTRQALNVAAKAAGKLPAHLERIANELAKPQQNWREHMRRFVDQSSTTDYSWKVPDRRFGTADFILPGTVSDGVRHVVVARDTSGSINDIAVGKFNAEMQALLDEGAIDQITVIDCDAAVQQVLVFTAGDIVAKHAPKGGGGTSFRPVWKWIADNAQDAAAVVYFTDLEPCDGFGDEPLMPVLWAAYATYGGPGPLRERMKTVPFGECIEIAD